MLVDSILCSIEALYGMTNAHMDKIEKVDKYLLKQNLNASFATPTEALYLETSLFSLQISVISCHLMFYWSILLKSDKGLVKKVFNVQKISQIKMIDIFR